MSSRGRLTRVESEIKLLADELRSFNVNADHKIKNIMSNVVDEEQSKQAKELNEVKAHIRVEEEEINRYSRKNQELLQKIQNAEREGKTKIISKQNENMRLKEDFNNLEGQYNKLFILLGNEKKEIDKKRATAARLENEHADIKEKTETIEMNYNQELDEIYNEHTDNIRELENNLHFYQEEQLRLTETIREENDKISESNKKQQEMFANIENNLNNTINKHANYNRKELYEDDKEMLNSRYNY